MKKKYLSELYIYPVKSCKGMSLRSVQVGAKGPLMDRRWMFVDKTGRFLSQRSIAKLAMIHVQLDDHFLFLSAPSTVPLMIPYGAVGSPCEVEVWDDRLLAHDMGEKASLWATNFLGQEARLVFLPDGSHRFVGASYGKEAEAGFADRLPFVLLSDASLADLNKRVGMTLRMNRFRPNLVIGNAEPYEEDTWKRIRIGDIIFHFVKPCARSIVTTINQERAEAGDEPLTTLATFRKEDDNILFGQSLIHEGSGLLEVGQEVEILE